MAEAQVGKTNWGNEELASLANAIKEGRTNRRRRLEMQLALLKRPCRGVGYPCPLSEFCKQLCRHFYQGSYVACWNFVLEELCRGFWPCEVETKLCILYRRGCSWRNKGPYGLNNLLPRKTLSKLKQYMKAMSGKGQNTIRQNDRKTYAGLKEAPRGRNY